MTGIFDGVAGMLNVVFGAPVTITPERGPAVETRGLFREEPVVIGQGEGGDILDVQTVLKIQRPTADDIKTGAVVAPGNGKTYRVINRLPSGSPAADAFVTFQLEDIN